VFLILIVSSLAIVTYSGLKSLTGIFACFIVYLSLPTDSTSSDDIPSIDSLLIDLSTLQVATDYFGEHKRLGEGGFGVVYKVPICQTYVSLWFLHFPISKFIYLCLGRFTRWSRNSGEEALPDFQARNRRAQN
jgi:hypothetical protein